MIQRKPRLDKVQRTVWQDFVALSHLSMFLPILCFMIAGTFLAVKIDYFRLILMVIGVGAGVILGAYRLNAIRDGGSTLPNHKNIVLAIFGLTIFMWCLSTAAEKYGWLILVFGALGLFAMVIYNLVRNPIIHNSVVYGLCWGFMPVVLANCFQTLTWPSWSVVALGLLAAVFARAYTWNHGLRICGVYSICKRGKDMEPCHSNAITCRERLVMPKSISDHAKLRLSMDRWMVLLLTAFIVLAHFKF